MLILPLVDLYHLTNGNPYGHTKRNLGIKNQENAKEEEQQKLKATHGNEKETVQLLLLRIIRINSKKKYGK